MKAVKVYVARGLTRGSLKKENKKRKKRKKTY